MEGFRSFVSDRYYRLAAVFLVASGLLTFFLLGYFRESFEGTLLPELIGFCLEGAVFLGVANAIIKRRESIKREEHLRVAFYPVRAALIAYCNVLFHAKKATSFEADQEERLDIESFLSSLDPSALSQLPFKDEAPIRPTKARIATWHEYLTASTLDFRDAIEKALDRYLLFLEAPQTKALEDVANDNFIESMDMSLSLERTYGQGELAGSGLALLALQFVRVNDQPSRFGERILDTHIFGKSPPTMALSLGLIAVATRGGDSGRTLRNEAPKRVVVTQRCTQLSSG